MLQPHDITFIIPVFRLDYDRELNFWYTYNHIARVGDPSNIIVVEQLRAGHSGGLEFKLVNNLFPGVRYYSLQIDDYKIHKSKLINHAVKHVNTPFAWVNDTDSFLNYPQVLKQINPRHRFIQPFTKAINLNKQETLALRSNRPLPIDLSTTTRRELQMYGALSFIFNKQAFESIGGMDESYTGWGWEDVDLHTTVGLTNTIHHTDNIAAHMFHEPYPGHAYNYKHFRRKYPWFFTAKTAPRTKPNDYEINPAQMSVGVLNRIVADKIHVANIKQVQSEPIEVTAARQVTHEPIEVTAARQLILDSPEIARIRKPIVDDPLIVNKLTNVERIDPIVVTHIREKEEKPIVITPREKIEVDGDTPAEFRLISNVDDNITVSINSHYTDQVQAAIPSEETSTPRKIIHVVNMIDPATIKNQSLKHRVKMCLESIEAAYDASDTPVVLIACVAERIPPMSNWNIFQLERSARTQLRHGVDLAFIKDMLDVANTFAREHDTIIYSNLDVVLVNNFYDNIPDDMAVVEYHRRDVDAFDFYEYAFKRTWAIRPTGIDAFAIQSSSYDLISNLMPDMVIGEPHWDTVMSGIIHKIFKRDQIHKNTTDLYHHRHSASWSTDNLSLAGKYNDMHYQQCKQYGLLAHDIIQLDKSHACIVVMDRKHDQPGLRDYIIKTACITNMYVVEMLDPGEKPIYSDIEHVSHTTLYHTPETRKTDQTNSLMNKMILGNSYCDRFTTVRPDELGWKPEHDVNTLYDVYEKEKNIFDFYLNDDGFLYSVR